MRDIITKCHGYFIAKWDKFITKCVRFFITKCDRNLLQNASGILLQNGTVVLQNATVITKCYDFITKCDRYYKMQCLLQTATVHLFYPALN